MGSDLSSVAGEPSEATGVYLLDKPAGMTSFGVVHRVRRLLGIKKVGHAGTLDPFATGLLIVCVGRPATRLIERFMAGRKTYRACLQLGVETETLDPEGKVVATTPVPELAETVIRDCLAGFKGKQKQIPPAFSALKHKGKPLYAYARKGIHIEKEPREIELYAIEFRSYDRAACRLEIEVTCSRGTYIRVLAADIGRRLGCGAYLVALRRTASGKFSLADSLDGQELADDNGLAELRKNKISLERALQLLEGAIDEPAGENP